MSASSTVRPVAKEYRIMQTALFGLPETQVYPPIRKPKRNLRYPTSDYMSVAEYSKVTGLSVHRVRQLALTGSIPGAVKDSGLWWITRNPYEVKIDH